MARSIPPAWSSREGTKDRAPARTKTGKVIRYKDKKDVAFEEGVQGQVFAQLRELDPDAPVGDALPVFARDVILRASFKFYFSRRPTNRDVQNYFKSICDALEGLVYVNDSQLVSVFGEKFHDKERPRIEVKVWRDDD